MIYFLLVVVVGNFLVLNLFLAILLSNFGSIPPPDLSPEAIYNNIVSMATCSAAKVQPAAEEGDEEVDEDLVEDMLNAFKVQQAPIHPDTAVKP